MLLIWRKKTGFSTELSTGAVKEGYTRIFSLAIARLAWGKLRSVARQA